MTTDLNKTIHALALFGLEGVEKHEAQVHAMLDQGATPDRQSLHLLFDIHYPAMEPEEEDRFFEVVRRVFDHIVESGYDPLNTPCSVFEPEQMDAYYRVVLMTLTHLARLEREKGTKIRTPQGQTALHCMLQETSGVAALSCMVLSDMVCSAWVTEKDEQGNTALHALWKAVQSGKMEWSWDVSLVSHALEGEGFTWDALDHQGVAVAQTLLSCTSLEGHWEMMDDRYELPEGSSESSFKALEQALQIRTHTPAAVSPASKPRF